MLISNIQYPTSNILHLSELDFDLAEMYGIATAQLKRAVKRNIERFDGDDFMFELTKDELSRCQIGTLNRGRGNNIKYLPFAFTEKGLYMLATILKSPQATQTTIAIVETFTKIRELTRTVAELSESKEEFTQKTLMEKGGEIMAEILGEGLNVTDTETSLELNFALFKVKHTVKRKNS